ncbi:hypothetical protein FB451DRAFT_1431305 [Mycena latifolia]|nr:hypothetical protein FB451DRAFT_1431305 [Mycena latifolia]
MFQKDRFRVVLFCSRRKDESVEEFKQDIVRLVNAWDALPTVQKASFNREVYLTMGNTSLASLSGTPDICDALIIMSYESKDSKEACEETLRHSVLRRPMSFQKDRFRVIFLFSRHEDESVEHFQKDLVSKVEAWEAVPTAQRTPFSRELCFTMGGTSALTQAANLAGTVTPSSYDATLIIDCESKEAWEEDSTAYKMLRDPEAIKRLRRNDPPRNIQIMTCEEIMIAPKKK